MSTNTRKRKIPEEAIQYHQELAKQEERAKRRLVNKELKKQIDDLSDLMAKMDTKMGEAPSSQMAIEEGGRRRRRTHKRRGGKRKTHRRR